MFCKIRDWKGFSFLSLSFISFKPSKAGADKEAASDWELPSTHLGTASRAPLPRSPSLRLWVLAADHTQQMRGCATRVLIHEDACQIRGCPLSVKHCRSKGLPCLMIGTRGDPTSTVPYDLEQVTEPLRPESQLENKGLRQMSLVT